MPVKKHKIRTVRKDITMKILVFGSMNIDKVYSLRHLPERGETLYCTKFETHVGGKGLNQAISLSKAGMDVYMAGCVGLDGGFLTNYLRGVGVNTSLVKISSGYSGHAIIEVDKNGQNQMILYPGANHEISEEYCDKILENFGKDDLILMQCETSCTEYMILKAHEKGIKLALNPSPFTEEVKKLPLQYVNYLFVNEDEGKSIAGEENIDKAVDKLRKMLLDGAVIMTLGADGSVYGDDDCIVKADAFTVNAVDTTGAGDTFTGYFLASLIEDDAPADHALRFASAASALAVQKVGAAETIPDRSEVEQFFYNF